ncbi:MAG: hypothetical protein IBJ00_00225 [Alphaproteobacteria bacterium]|nr:hypothetical protein [Alphaproteobacteria bacterium]
MILQKAIKLLLRITGMEPMGKLLKDKEVLPPEWVLTYSKAILYDGAIMVGDSFCKVQLKNGDHEY